MLDEEDLLSGSEATPRRVMMFVVSVSSGESDESDDFGVVRMLDEEACPLVPDPSNPNPNPTPNPAGLGQLEVKAALFISLSTLMHPP